VFWLRFPPADAIDHGILMFIMMSSVEPRWWAFRDFASPADLAQIGDASMDAD
jgi:hypothetical protein